MLALYRSGRQAEALDAYQDTRRVLVDELGLAPSRAIVELEQAILRQDPSLEVLQPVAAQPPAAADAGSVRGRRADGVFVGRERELAALVAALGDALSGSGRLVLVGGEPGIGKSRLAEELASRARANGAEIYWGRAWEDGRRSSVLALGAGASGVRCRTQLRPARRRARPRRVRDRRARPRRATSCCPASRCRTSRRILSRHVSVSSMRSRDSLRGRVAPGPSSSSWTTCTGPTRARCFCSSSWRESSPTHSCCSSARIATSR